MSTTILFDSARAARRCLPVFLAIAAVISLAAGCKPSVQEVRSTDIGGGVRQGSPPMCFQARGESRPADNARNIWVHINNTCSYAVDCSVYDDVTEQQHRMAAPGYQTRSFMVAAGVPDTSVDLDLDCTWKP